MPPPVRDRLAQAYWTLERRVTPGLQYAQMTYEQVLDGHVRDTTVWLDVGCGRRLLPAWRQEAEAALMKKTGQVVGVDVDHGALVDNCSVPFRCQASATRLPFANATFDLVTANMVVEHLDDPESQFHEISRVIRPGGVFIFHTPNAMGYQTMIARLIPESVKARLAHYLDGRDEQDVYPTFYRANSRRAIDALARASSFAIVDLKFILTSAACAVVLPLAFLELLWMRMLMQQRMEHLRTNIIGILQKLDPATVARA